MFKPRSMFSLVFAVVLAIVSTSASLASPAPKQSGEIPPVSAGQVLVVENAGQWPAAARFQVWGAPIGSGTTWTAEDAIWFVDATYAIKLTFPGSAADKHLEPFDPQATTVSFFNGDDPTKWRSSVSVWSGVRYVNLYPGIDLVLGGPEGDWRLEAALGADTDQVRLQIEGADSASIDGRSLQLDAGGESLHVTLPAAQFEYLVVDRSQGDELRVLSDNQHDPRPYRPDNNPDDLMFSTFLGGGNADWGSDITADDAGNAYVTGLTDSNDFPTTPGVFEPALGGSYDVFVAKINPDGNALVYSTFIGGSNFEDAGAIAIDSAANVYVTGSTRSSDFPTTPGAFSTSLRGSSDVFVAKLNPTGSALIYSTLLGGISSDHVSGIALDSFNMAHVAGTTNSSDFPTTPGAFDTSYNGWDDAFAVKLDATGSSLVYATYLGGSLYDIGTDIAISDSGESFVTGSTWSDDFPTTPGAFSTSLNGSAWDAFVIKLNSAGNVVYSTLLGGSGHETSPVSIALDETGDAYISGATASADFPVTAGAYDPTFNGGETDSFVAALNQNGSQLVYATYLGGSGDDRAYDVNVDSAGIMFVSGVTSSDDFPTTPNAFDTTFNGGTKDAFVAQLNSSGSMLTYSTFLGGSDDESVRRTVLKSTGNVLMTGSTYSSDFPVTPGAFDTSYNGGVQYEGGDAFVTELDMIQPPLAVALTSLDATADRTPDGAIWLMLVMAVLTLVASLRFGWLRATRIHKHGFRDTQ